MRSLREAGWTIACVRLPVDAALNQVEDELLPDDGFARLCEAIDVPYFDHSAAPFPCRDGVHLAPDGIEPYRRLLLHELSRLPAW